jgi:ribonuclease P protein component
MPTKRFRFPKARRLTTPAEFNRVRKNGATERGRLLTIGVLPVDQGPFRAGFVTSRKVGGAVARNRVRRRLREIVRKHQHQIVESVWIVTIARELSSHASYAELEDAWLRLAKRASILAP